MEGQVVQLRETTPKIGRGELRRFLSRIKFVDSPYQVKSLWKKCLVTTEGWRHILPTPSLLFRRFGEWEPSRVAGYQETVIFNQCYFVRVLHDHELLLSCFELEMVPSLLGDIWKCGLLAFTVTPGLFWVRARCTSIVQGLWQLHTTKNYLAQDATLPPTPLKILRSSSMFKGVSWKKIKSLGLSGGTLTNHWG